MKKLVLWSILLTVIFIACKKESRNFSPSNEIGPVIQPPNPTKTAKYKSIAEKFLGSAKFSSNFKKIIYQKCFDQRYGDYYITVKDLLALNDTLSFWNAATKKIIADLTNDIRAIDGSEPIVYIPWLEEKTQDWITNNQFPTTTPDGVVSEEYDTTSHVCAAYTLNSSNVLTAKNMNADETYAWANDLWVFGSEEVVSPDNMVAGVAKRDDEIVSNRFEGQIENGGIIQVTDLNKLEHWIMGKLELRMLVFSASGTNIKNKYFGKRKRREFRNQVWKDFNEFLYYWNTPNIGNWTIEHWIEEDGGQSATISYTVPPPAGQPGPTVSITIPSKQRDDDMGKTIIQFTDPISTQYGITYANIKRKN